MKVIFYPCTLKECSMTTTERIVYSQILYRSLWDNESDSTFTKEDGRFSIETYEYDYGGIVPLGWSVSNSMAKDVNVSRTQFFQAKKNLEDNGYLIDGGIRLIEGVTATFFELKTTSGLRGLPLIVFSYLSHKCAKYGQVDKYHGAMAEELGMDRTNLEHILTDLRNRHYITVQYKGRQPLIKTVI